MKSCKLCGVEIPKRKHYCDECRGKAEQICREKYKEEKKLARMKRHFVRAKSPEEEEREREEEVKRKKTREKCEKCFYSTEFSGLGNKNYIGCGYILVTGHSRGCPASENCEKFKRRR